MSDETPELRDDALSPREVGRAVVTDDPSSDVARSGATIDIRAASAEGVARVRSAERRRQHWRVVREWALVLVIALGAALLIRSFVFQQYYIDGPSMQTTLEPQDRVLVNKLSYRLHDVNRGDVVVFDRITVNGNDVQHDDLIKRVIGLPGETLEIRGCVVYVDGRAVEEPYLPDEALAAADPAERCGRWTDRPAEVIPEGAVFVMGDNRVQSFDSRDFGPIDTDLIRGRAFVVIWPIGSWAWL
jgi:signal peptidase I